MDSVGVSATDSPTDPPTQLLTYLSARPPHKPHLPATYTCPGTFGKKKYESTAVWQTKLQSYLEENGVGFFYWTLNDNSFSTGGRRA